MANERWSRGALQTYYPRYCSDNSSHMHCGIASLCRSLLQIPDYFLIGTFSIDPLEKELGKLHQGSIGIYFITVQQIIEKVNISNQDFLLLSPNTNVYSFNIENSHSNFNLNFLLDENLGEIFDGLPELESSVPENSKMIAIHGYDPA